MSWNLRQGAVEASLGPFTAVLAPDKPQLGLEILRHSDLLGHAFSVSVPTEFSFTVEEAYQRGNDFIVRFDQSGADTFAFQLDWRILANCSTPGIELWLSVQTDDLDSSPVLAIASDLKSEGWTGYNNTQLLNEADEPTQTSGPNDEPPAALVSNSNEISALWLIEPTDQQHVQCEETGKPTLKQIRLFDHFMEKGVIRRARMRCHLSETPFSGRHSSVVPAAY